MGRECILYVIIKEKKHGIKKKLKIIRQKILKAKMRDQWMKDFAMKMNEKLSEKIEYMRDF